MNGATITLIVVIAVWLTIGVVCLLKGKLSGGLLALVAWPVSALGALVTLAIGISEALSGDESNVVWLFWPAAIMGLVAPIASLSMAIRLAEPDSWWAGRFYDPAKLARAEDRYR